MTLETDARTSDDGETVDRDESSERTTSGTDKASDAAKSRKTSDQPSEDGDKPDQNDKDDDADAKAPRRPRGPWIAAGLAAAVVLGVGGYLYWDVYVYPYETTDDAFVDAHSFSVATKVAGFVVDAPVTDNQHVATGDTLFQIDRRDYEASLEQAEAQVMAAEAAIANVDAQIEGQRSQVEVAQAQVSQADATLKFAKQDAARYADLAKNGYGTVKNEQSSSSTLNQQQAALSQAQASLAAAEQMVRTLQAQRKSSEAQRAVAVSQRDQATLNLSYATVTAAQPGRVVRLMASKGAYAQGGQGLATFVPDEIYVTANFKETQVDDMRPGQKVDVEIDAYPGHKIEGRVDSVQPGSGTAFSLLPAENATGNYVKVVQRIPVKIVIDRWPEDLAIGPGMSIVPTVRVR